jgi:hypothetical protein
MFRNWQLLSLSRNLPCLRETLMFTIMKLRIFWGSNTCGQLRNHPNAQGKLLPGFTEKKPHHCVVKPCLPLQEAADCRFVRVHLAYYTTSDPTLTITRTSDVTSSFAIDPGQGLQPAARAPLRPRLYIKYTWFSYSMQQSPFLRR